MASDAAARHERGGPGPVLAPLRSLKAGLRFSVTDMLSWRVIIRNWFEHANTGLASQQDSAHFLEHLTQAGLPLFNARWHSVNVDGVLADQGLLPLRLELNSDLQDSLDGTVAFTRHLSPVRRHSFMFSLPGMMLQVISWRIRCCFSLTKRFAFHACIKGKLSPPDTSC